MRSVRPALTILLGIALVCALMSNAGATTPATSPPIPSPDTSMGSWGYWTSILNESASGNAAHFLRQDLQKKLGTNTILLGPEADNANLAQITNEVSLAKARGVGVILYLSLIFNKGCAWNRGPNQTLLGYGKADYDAYERDLTTLADALAPYKDTIVAIIGFDDMNPFAGLCYFGADGFDNAVSESMRLTAIHFPDTKYRGHVWQIAGWSSRPPVSANLLDNSTMLFPYAYHGTGGFDQSLVPTCPQQGTFPRSTIPDSYAARDEGDLRDFLGWVNAQPGHEQTPVMFIAYAAQPGLKLKPVFALGLACTLTSLWYHMHCLSAADDNSWVQQVRGLIGFAWQTNTTYGWLGASQVPQQKAAGKWIGANGKTCRFSAQRDFEDSHGDQQYWRWRYEQCPVPTTSSLGTCTRMKDRDGDTYLTDDHTGSLDATSAKPPVDATTAVARRWTAPRDGTATIRLNLQDLEPSPPCVVAGTDDGARVAIFKDNTKIWPTTTDWAQVRNGGTTNVTLADLALTSGTQLRFLVQRGTTAGATNLCDRTALAPDIDFTWR